MLQVRASHDRGLAQFDWLDSRHTFSFGHYYDPAHMGFGVLRVINEDKIKPGKGFGTHGHQDMEIITYVLQGALEHRDSLGNGSIIRPGDVQRMTAGTGIRHSEFNASATDPVHLLQIWILPDTSGLTPGYEEIRLDSPVLNSPLDAASGSLRLIGSRDGREGSVTIHQDVSLYAIQLTAEQSVTHDLAPHRSAWVQVARGSIALNDRFLEPGDGVAIQDLDTLTFTGRSPAAELLLFDLPA
ncbi:MAG: pirin family protein [Prochlorotrichaceae cyanobacterium]